MMPPRMHCSHSTQSPTGGSAAGYELRAASQSTRCLRHSSIFSAVPLQAGLAQVKLPPAHLDAIQGYVSPVAQAHHQMHVSCEPEAGSSWPHEPGTHHMMDSTPEATLMTSSSPENTSTSFVLPSHTHQPSIQAGLASAQAMSCRQQDLCTTQDAAAWGLAAAAWQ